jgi:hypothetical protein
MPLHDSDPRRKRERPAKRKYFLFHCPDLLHFSAFFVNGDNFVFRYETFGAVSAILNSDNETMWITAILLTGFLIWASATK